ncbi:hypothetical protein BRADI_2g22010v3, partial [Brachypodium distachyon]
MINHLMSGRVVSDMHHHDSSLGLMQFHDPHQYMYSSSSSTAGGSFLPHHHAAFIKDVAPAEPLVEILEEAPGAAGAPAMQEERKVVDEAAEEEEGEEAAAESHGVRMIALLMECAVAMSVGNLADANGALLELSQMASPYAASCGERLVAYFARALAARLMSSWVGVCAPLSLQQHDDAGIVIHAAFRAFYNVAPFARAAYLACNQAVLDAFRGQRAVHIVDLDMVPGGALQWLSLLPALAARPGGPPALLRVTGFGVSAALLHDAGNQLAGLAGKLGLPFEFYAVAKRPGDAAAAVSSGLLLPGKRPGEAVAVHWLRHALYDAAGDEAAAIRLARWLEPRVMTVVDQERSLSSSSSSGAAADDGGSFLDRFVSALHHYSAAFDSLGAARPAGDDASRHLAENGMLGREIGNVLAIAGPSRSGRERLLPGSWQAELARHGFLRARWGSGGARAQMLAGACPAGLGYTVADDAHDGTVRLGWKGTPLYAVSTWTWCATTHGH